MLKNIKNSFNHTNKYIILATPLILFSLLSNLYLFFTASNGNVLSLLFGIIIFFIMLAAFLAGWFNMITDSLKDPHRENVNSLMSEFVPGVGEYILSTIGLIFNIIIFSVILLTLSFFIGIKCIGNIGVSSATMAKAMSSVESVKHFLTSLSDTQLLKLNAWNFLLFGTMIIIHFSMMLYAPALFFKNKNPFKALFIALKDLFSLRFFKNIAAFFIAFGTYFIISVLSTLFSANIITYFIFTLLNFYLAVFIAVFVFDYYYSNYVKVGSNIDTTV